MPAPNSKKPDGGVAKGPRLSISSRPGNNAAASQRGGKLPAMFTPPDRPDTWLAPTLPAGLRGHPKEGWITNSPRRNSLTYTGHRCYLLIPE
jgi:hypothetical protein